ncbi:MAG: hypothetical protein JSR78_13220 [Proteobacteria bacterium]|nr:hypothetical protein [Pseudomonadota bacterium]
MDIAIFAVGISTIEDAEKQVQLSESRTGDSRRAALSTHVEESLRKLEA